MKSDPAGRDSYRRRQFQAARPDLEAALAEVERRAGAILNVGFDLNAWRLAWWKNRRENDPDLRAREEERIPDPEAAAEHELAFHGEVARLLPELVKRVREYRGARDRLIAAAATGQRDNRFVGTRRELTVALGKSANYPNYLERLSDDGLIELKRLRRLFAIVVKPGAPRTPEQVRAKLDELRGA
jgi:hypothetical protein